MKPVIYYDGMGWVLKVSKRRVACSTWAMAVSALRRYYAAGDVVRENPVELKPCPFCGNSELKFGGWPGLDSWVECKVCGSRGPSVRGRKPARERWNYIVESRNGSAAAASACIDMLGAAGWYAGNPMLEAVILRIRQRFGLPEQRRCL